MSQEQLPLSPQVIRQRTSGLAIASLVLSLIFCLPLIGSVLSIVLGVVALSKIDRNPQELSGRGLATAGIIVGVVSLFITIMFVSACMKTYRRVDPLVENVLVSMDAGDYEAAMKDFDTRLARVLTLERLTEIGDALQQRLGRYRSRRWGYTYQWRKNLGTPLTLVIIYKCRYSKTDENVYVTVSFLKHGGHYEIGGLWFRSPELEDLQQKPKVDT
jgi:hypothetical protein